MPQSGQRFSSEVEEKMNALLTQEFPEGLALNELVGAYLVCKHVYLFISPPACTIVEI